MKLLLVYFSHSGNTRKMCSKAAKELSADLCELTEPGGRRGFFRLVTGAIAIMRNKPSRIDPIDVDPAAYDVVFLGSPIWAGHLPPPVMSFLTQYGKKISRLYLALTAKDPKPQNVPEHCEKLDVRPAGIKVYAPTGEAFNFFIADCVETVMKEISALSGDEKKGLEAQMKWMLDLKLSPEVQQILQKNTHIQALKDS